MICPTLQYLKAWPANAKVEAWKMAKAGFRYTGQEEEVACSIIRTIKNWQSLKDLEAERAKSSSVFLVRSLALGVAVYWGTGSMVTRYLL